MGFDEMLKNKYIDRRTYSNIIKSICGKCNKEELCTRQMFLSCGCIICLSCYKKAIENGTYISKRFTDGSNTIVECKEHSKPLLLNEFKGAVSSHAIEKASVNLWIQVLNKSNNAILLSREKHGSR